MPRTLVMVWEGGANLGHLGRLLPIARHLRARGWVVVFALAQERAGHQYVGPEGFAWVRAPLALAEAGLREPVVSHDELYLRTAFPIPEASARCVLEWISVFDRWGAVAVVADASPLALMAAACAEIPAMAVGHGFEIPPAGPVLPCFAPWADDVKSRMRAARDQLHANMALLANALPVGLGRNAPLSLNALFGRSAAALCVFEEMDHFGGRDLSAGGTVYVGPIWHVMAGSLRLQWPDRPGPRMLVYLNLKDKRHDLLWQAARQKGFNVVVISPGGNPKACQAARGWGIHVVEQSVDWPRAVDECDAVVSHGGVGTVAAALLGGKPVLLLPEHVEQGLFASRLAQQGLAAATVRLRNRSRLGEQVDRLLDDEAMRAQLAGFRARHVGFTPEKAAERVAGIAEALADDRRSNETA